VTYFEFWDPHYISRNDRSVAEIQLLPVSENKGVPEFKSRPRGPALCLPKSELTLVVKNQFSRSNVNNFQTLLAFAMGHIHTKLHQFLISSFRDFVRTDTRRHAHRRRQKQYCSQHSWRAGKKNPV